MQIYEGQMRSHTATSPFGYHIFRATSEAGAKAYHDRYAQSQGWPSDTDLSVVAMTLTEVNHHGDVVSQSKLSPPCGFWKIGHLTG